MTAAATILQAVAVLLAIHGLALIRGIRPGR